MKKGLIFILTAVFLLLFNVPASACTIFNVSDGGKTFVGNNEDGDNQNTNAWFLPAEDGKFGAVLFGYEDAWAQGGMNDQGLFMDWAVTQTQQLTPSPEKANYKGVSSLLYYPNFNEKVLRECSNLEEALDMYSKYNEPSFAYAHVMIVDKTGASAVVELYKGQINVLKKEGNYQFMTNFNLSISKLSGYKDPRYSTLEEKLDDNSDVTVDNFRSLLGAVKQDVTVYSNIYDLNTGNIYLYYKGNFDKVIKFNLYDELKKGKHIYNMKTLFSYTKAVSNENANNKNPFQTDQYRNQINMITLILFGFMVILLAVHFIRRSAGRDRRRRSLASERLMTAGIAASILNGILYIVFLKGLTEYGFFIRYGFDLYEQVLYFLPYIILSLTLIQLICLVFSWKRNAFFLVEKAFYLLYTGGILYLGYLMQSFCWSLI